MYRWTDEPSLSSSTWIAPLLSAYQDNNGQRAPSSSAYPFRGAAKLSLKNGRSSSEFPSGLPGTIYRLYTRLDLTIWCHLRFKRPERLSNVRGNRTHFAMLNPGDYKSRSTRQGSVRCLSVSHRIMLKANSHHPGNSVISNSPMWRMGHVIDS